MKLFIENSLNKLDFFRKLDMLIKNDIIYAMELV